jgi:DNA-3-methyladenine glycosylase (3mg)
MQNKKLEKEFFKKDVLKTAEELVGKLLCRKMENGEIIKLRITETEAYKGIEDEACHARKGKTERNKVMWEEGGKIYVYLIYGMYWLLNIVTAEKDNPQAVLIRACENFNGPGKITKHLNIDKTFYGQDIAKNEIIWIEDDEYKGKIIKDKRININYAGEYYRDIPWRFIDNTVTNKKVKKTNKKIHKYNNI